MFSSRTAIFLFILFLFTNYGQRDLLASEGQSEHCYVEDVDLEPFYDDVNKIYEFLIASEIPVMGHCIETEVRMPAFTGGNESNHKSVTTLQFIIGHEWRGGVASSTLGICHRVKDYKGSVLRTECSKIEVY